MTEQHIGSSNPGHFKTQMRELLLQSDLDVVFEEELLYGQPDYEGIPGLISSNGKLHIAPQNAITTLDGYQEFVAKVHARLLGLATESVTVSDPQIPEILYDKDPQEIALTLGEVFIVQQLLPTMSSYERVMIHPNTTVARRYKEAAELEDDDPEKLRLIFETAIAVDEVEEFEVPPPSKEVLEALERLEEVDLPRQFGIRNLADWFGRRFRSF